LGLSAALRPFGVARDVRETTKAKVAKFTKKIFFSLRRREIRFLLRVLRVLRG